MDRLLKTLAISLMLRGVFTKDIPVSSHYVLKHTDSCPDVGYYFRREPMPNVVGPGPCYLCFCQENNTAVCWLRENSRCNVEMFHHHRVGRNTRARRSPTGLGDIFFRDATRDFFHKQLPKVCKPNVSSFSDGCPPADWCLGCTVCDCDANGQWDCHILSFCNKEDKKKKPKRRVPMPRRRVYHKGLPKNNVTIKIDNKTQQIERRKRNNDVWKSAKNDRKPAKTAGRNQSKKPDNVRKNQPKRKLKQQQKRLQQRRNKKQANRKTSTQKPNKKESIHTTRKPKKKFLRKNEKKVVMTTGIPIELTEKEVTKVMDAKTTDAQTLLGRRIVKKVMETVHKIMDREDRKKNAANGLARVQRSADVENPCPYATKTNKKKNKPRKKNRFGYKQRHYKEKDWSTRKKREAFDLNLSVMEFRESSDNIDKMHFKDNSSYTDEVSTSTGTTSTTIVPIMNATFDSALYYTITLDKSATTSISNNIQTDLIPAQKGQNKSMNVTLNKPENKTETVLDKSKSHDIMTDSKYNEKWEGMKMIRDNEKKYETWKVYTKDKNNIVNDSNIATQLKSKIHRKDIERKLNVTKKFKLKKIIIKNFKTQSTKYLSNQLSANEINHNITSLHGLLQNLMKEISRKDTTQTKLKQKFSIFQYLRNIFEKVFYKRKGSHIKHKTNEGHTLEILCEHIGACYQNKHNRIAVRSKLHDLNAETEKIFRTIKIIKGLLSLIELPDIKINENEGMNHDILKLNAILKGTYQVGRSSVSETLAAQVNYLKENIHQFIESVSKFASILNEIINILFKNNKKYGCLRTVRLNQKKKKLNSYNKIKQLLVKYNLLQNTFMKNMYKLLTDVEKKQDKTTEKLKPKVSDVDMNNSQIIDKYTKNIIENLRKLNNLAKVLNSNRRKRQTMREDDAIEYLLVLMEYLLKQNHPLDTAPVNDGIDLLIEAIQNTPHIKQIKKKVLEHIPTIPPATRTTSIDLSFFKEDSISDSNRISKEENNASKYENNLSIEQSFDKDQITQIVYYKKFNDNNTTAHNEYDVTSEYSINRNSETAETKYNLEKTGFDRFESAIDDTRRYEVFTSDLEDEGIIPIIISTTPINKKSPSSENPKVEDTTFIALRHYKLDDDIPDDENKTKLDWIEENFGKEIREYREENTDVSNITSQLVTSTLSTTTVTTMKANDKSIDNISSITVELEDEQKKKKSKEAADEVMYKKQLEFLNSLDYGTERSDFDNSESKDDERYSSEGFASFFVK